MSNQTEAHLSEEQIRLMRLTFPMSQRWHLYQTLPKWSETVVHSFFAPLLALGAIAVKMQQKTAFGDWHQQCRALIRQQNSNNLNI